jgi:hypothetical protein
MSKTMIRRVADDLVVTTSYNLWSRVEEMGRELMQAGMLQCFQTLEKEVSRHFKRRKRLRKSLHKSLRLGLGKRNKYRQKALPA